MLHSSNDMDVLTLVMIGILLICGILLALFFVLGVFKRPNHPAYQDYERVEYLLSPAEHAFFQVLLQSVTTQQYVFAKCRIGDLVRVNGLIVESKDWWKKFGPIAKKHVDFVVATRSPVKPLVVIELDDSSHQSTRARQRDTLVDRVMHAAGLPIIHIPYNRHGYSVSHITSLITTATQKEAVPTHPDVT